MKNKKYLNAKRIEATFSKAPDLVLQRLEEEITSNKIYPTYIIFSSDNVIVDEIISLLKETLLTPGFESFDFDLLHCEDVSVSEILTKVFTPPLAAKRRLVVIKDGLKLNSETRAQLIAELVKPRDFSVVLLVTEWEKNFAQVLEAQRGLTQAVAVYNFYKPFLSALKEQIRNIAQKKGMLIDSNAIDLLIEIAGESPDILNEELEKIRTLIGPSRITEAVVKKIAAKSHNYELNELTGAIALRNLKKSLRTLFHLQEWGEEPVKIIGFTGNELFRILRVLELKSERSRVAKEFGFKENSRRVQELIDRARNWTKKSLNKCLIDLAKMDKAIKNGYPQPYFLLEQFLLKNLSSGEQRL